MVTRRCGLATFKEKGQRDFRLQTGSTTTTPTSLEFNKIKVGKSTLNGEIATLIRDNRNPGGRRYNKKMVVDAIDRNNVREMRRISEYFFHTSGIYSRLCRYLAYLPRYDWLITPHRYDEKIKDDKILEGWIKASRYLEDSKLKQSFGRYSLEVVKKGCYYGYILDKGTAAYLQELPADYCRARYEVDGRPAVEFKITFFDDYFSDNAYKLRVLKSFPKEFQKAYIAYKNGTLPRDFAGDDNGWFLLDPAKTVKFSLCNNDAPLFISAIPTILDLEDAKQLDRDKLKQQLLKIIIQQMPIDKNGDLIFDVTEANALHNNAVNMLADAIGVDVLTTFADVTVADMSDKSNVTSIDMLERFERSVYNEIGTSQKQFNTDGQNALDKSIANDEALMTDLLDQYAEYAERLLSVFNKNPKRLRYTVMVLPTTIYNYKDLSKMYKEQTQLGFSKLLPQVAMGHSQLDIIYTAVFENEILSLNDLFVPPQMSSTMSSSNKATGTTSKTTTQKEDSDAQSKGGRPELADDQKSEKTLKNLESAN